MCVVSVAWNAHPRWKLIVAGNRDEFHACEAAPLGPWADAPGIIAGRDLLSQGTWMGVSNLGRFGVVTNVRNPQGPDPDKASRGALVTNWLTMSHLPEALDAFNPFNLLLADQSAIHLLSNRPSDQRARLGDGIHGLSNAVSDSVWPRKDRLNDALKSWLSHSADEPTELFGPLSDCSVEGADGHPLFIRHPVYGTRCSTVLAVDKAGAGQIIERRFDKDGHCTGESAHDFRWPV